MLYVNTCHQVKRYTQYLHTVESRHIYFLKYLCTFLSNSVHDFAVVIIITAFAWNKNKISLENCCFHFVIILIKMSLICLKYWFCKDNNIVGVVIKFCFISSQVNPSIFLLVKNMSLMFKEVKQTLAFPNG